MKWVIRGYSFILLGYTGWRTFDFMSSQLPKDDLSFWLSIVFLFATEIGLLIWHEQALSHVTTETQEGIAKWMTGLDFIGSTAAGVADMILRQTLVENYVIPAWLVQFLIYGLPLIVAANVGAVLLYLWFDGRSWLEREKRQTMFEITRTAINELKKDRKEIAHAKKGVVYSTLRADVVAQIDKEYGALTQAERDEKKGRAAAPQSRRIIYGRPMPRNTEMTQYQASAEITTDPTRQARA